MPELVKSNVASPPGTSDIDGTAVCPCSTKKSMKVCRISLPVIFLVILRNAPSNLSERIIPSDERYQKVPNLPKVRDLKEKVKSHAIADSSSPKIWAARKARAAAAFVLL